jgi:3-oxoacyl-(acyl-carrier-protein) synthase
MNPPAITVRGLGGASALGSGVAAQLAAMHLPVPPLRPLAGHPDCGGARPELLAGWIDDRSWLAGRKYGGAANAAVRAARMAVTEAGWSPAELADCHLFSGTSRGNTGELIGAWNARRPIRKLAASNSMHSETASAVSIELGIRGPWLCLSNGCSSGLDALVLAYQTLASGCAKRALVVGVDFPLLPPLLDAFLATGLLSHNNVNDPYSERTTGFLPGEAVAALALEIGDFPGPRVLAALANSDAYDNIAPAPAGGPTSELLEAVQQLPQLRERRVAAICPHASGTAAHGAAESAAINRVFHDPSQPPVSLHFMKPFTGHSLGASGAIDCLLLCAFLRQSLLPPNLPGLATPCPQRLPAPATTLPFDPATYILKLSTGMGGRNTVVAFGLPTL